MIVLSLLLVMAAAVLLVLGIFDETGLGLIYGSIGACVAALIFLGIGVLQRRRAAEPATGTDGGYGPGADRGATPVRPIGGGPRRGSAEAAADADAVDATGPASAPDRTATTAPTGTPDASSATAGADDGAEIIPKTTAADAAERAADEVREPSGTAGDAADANAPSPDAGTAEPDAVDREVLAGVKGIGPAKQEALLERFGSVEAIRAASVDQLTEVKGFGSSLAEQVASQLNGAGQTTGAAAREVLAGIKGIGPTKQEALLERFGSVEAIRAASVAELTTVKGFGQNVARQVKDQLG